jgi:hypothetical protein
LFWQRGKEIDLDVPDGFVAPADNPFFEAMLPKRYLFQSFAILSAMDL